MGNDVEILIRKVAGLERTVQHLATEVQDQQNQIEEILSMLKRIGCNVRKTGAPPLTV